MEARRRQRAKERSFVLPVRGYEDVGLNARYRVLGYEELRDIDLRNKDLDGPEGELARYADTLIEACEELLDGDQGLGCKWSSTAAVLREKLGVDVPEGAGARDNVFAVFNGTGGGNDLFLHWHEWDLEASKTVEEIDEEQAGEFRPSLEGSSKSVPTPSPEEWASTPGSSIPAGIPTT